MLHIQWGYNRLRNFVAENKSVSDLPVAIYAVLYIKMTAVFSRNEKGIKFIDICFIRIMCERLSLYT